MGNPITNELPPSLDNFMQDMCQMYTKKMNYSHVAKFAEKATAEDIKALRKLYRKAKEAAEVDDEEEMQDIADEVEKLVFEKIALKDSIKESFEDEEDDPFAAEKEGNPYILGNCSICGAKGTDTVENFLKKYGFEDIDYSCDILDIDPLEEVCEECFKSWLPELNDKTYSEYDDLGTDTRTGLPFGEPFDESVKNKSSLKESCAYNIVQKVIKDNILPSTGYTETNEGIEATFNIKEVTDYTGLDDPLEAVEALFKGLGYDGAIEQIANEEEFITVEFPYTSENLTESESTAYNAGKKAGREGRKFNPYGLSDQDADDYADFEAGRQAGEAECSEDCLSDYQKDVIKDMVQADFECGHTMDYEEALAGMEEDEDLGPVAEEAANYYVELVQMGPAGIMDEIEDGWSDDYKAEYGIRESKKNTKKGLKESISPDEWNDIYDGFVESAIDSYPGDPADIDSQAIYDDMALTVEHFEPDPNDENPEESLRDWIYDHMQPSDYVPEYDDDEELDESKKNTKKALTESEEDEMWQAYNTWFDDCDAAYNRHEINDEFMADYNAFEQAYKTASGKDDVEYGSLKDIYDPWYESHAPHYDLSHADHWEAGWKFGKGLM